MICPMNGLDQSVFVNLSQLVYTYQVLVYQCVWYCSLPMVGDGCFAKKREFLPLTRFPRINE